MAKKRGFFRKARSRARSLFGRARKSYSRGGKSSLGMDMLYSGAYGAVRQDAARYVAPVSQYMPLGGLADEATLGLLAYGLYKWGPGMLKPLAKNALMVEAALAGASLRAGLGTSAVASGGRFQPSIGV